MSDATHAKRRSFLPPHRRLRALHVALFLAFGVALCGAEYSRRIAVRGQTAIIDFTDALRDQGGRAALLQSNAFSLANQADPLEQAELGARLREDLGALRSSHDQIIATIESSRRLPANATDPFERTTPLLQEMEDTVASSGPLDLGERIAPVLTQYRAVVRESARRSLEYARVNTRGISAFSMSLFAITAALLLVEAIVLIVPVTRRLREQWRKAINRGTDASPLSDRFRRLVESASRIEGLRDGEEDGRVMYASAGPDGESVLDLGELRSIQASLQLFEAAVTNSRDGIVIVRLRPTLEIVFANDAICELTGRGLDNLIGRSPLDLHDDETAGTGSLVEAINERQARTVQCVQHRTTGERIVTEVDTIPVDGPDPERPFVVLVYRDVTGRVEAQRALRESAERFELIGRVSLDGIYDLDLLTGRCWRNEPILRMFGQPGEGEGFFDWLRTRIHPDDAGDVIDRMIEFTKSDRSSWGAEYRQLKTDGSYAIVEDQASLIRDSSGQPIRLVGALRDITEQRAHQWEVEQYGQRLQQVLDDQTDLVCRYDREGVLIFVNQAYAEYFGRSREELLGTPFIELIPEDDREAATEAIRSLSREQPTATNEHRVVLRDGEIRWQRWTDRVITGEDGEVAAYQAVGRDITEEVLAKRRVEAAEGRYRAFIRNSSEAIFRLEFEPPIDTSLPAEEQARLIVERGVIAEVNDAFSRMYGRESAEESVGLTLRDLFNDDPGLIEATERNIADLARQGYQITGLISHEVKADGTPVTFSNNTVGIVEDGKLTRIWGTQLDITEQRLTEQKLRETNTMLEIFIERAPASVAMFDRDLRYIAVSRRWMTDYGIEERDIIGKSHYEVFPEITGEWKTIHQRCLAGETISREEDPFERADGSVQWLRWDVRPWHREDGSVGGVVMLTEDITERRHAEASLRRVNAQQERLLTELDHRVKNALGGLLSLIEMGTHEQTDVRSYAESIARRVRSMASVHAMLSESRWEPLGLDEIVKNITPADVSGRLAPDGPRVLIPAHQATPLAMVLQEFVSNSMKYGALSLPGGVARVEWSPLTDGAGEQKDLKIVWSERGGPPVEPPESEGVGTQLIRGFARFELRGSVEMDFSDAAGVRHTLVCRLEDGTGPDPHTGA